MVEDQTRSRSRSRSRRFPRKTINQSINRSEQAETWKTDVKKERERKGKLHRHKPQTSALYTPTQNSSREVSPSSPSLLSTKPAPSNGVTANNPHKLIVRKTMPKPIPIPSHSRRLEHTVRTSQSSSVRQPCNARSDVTSIRTVGESQPVVKVANCHLWRQQQQRW